MKSFAIKQSNGTMIAFGAILISILVTIVIVLFGSVEKYTWLFLLPLSFCLISCIFHRIYELIGISITASLLIVLMFLKNVITPLFMSFGDGYFAAVVDTSKTMFPAILLEIYEEIAVFTILYLKMSKLKRYISQSFSDLLYVRRDKIKYFKLSVLLLVAIAGVCLLRYPQLASYITVSMSGNKNIILLQARAKSLMVETTPSLVYYTYTLTVNILRWIVPAFVMFRLYISERREVTKIVWSFLAIGVSAVMMTDTVAVSIYIAVSYAFLLCRMYPARRKKILLFSIITVGVCGALLLLIKTFGAGVDAAIGEIAFMLQAYFSGPENVAVALAVDTPVSLLEVTGDIFKFIPYLTYYFRDLPSSNVLFNQTYWGRSDIATQIIPMISQGARHFTFVLAPVYTVLISTIAVNWEIKATRKGALLDYTVCAVACVCLSMSVALYSASLCLQLYLNYVLPLQIILWIVRRTSVK